MAAGNETLGECIHTPTLRAWAGLLLDCIINMELIKSDDIDMRSVRDVRKRGRCSKGREGLAL